LSLADQIDNTAKQVNVSAESLQALRRATQLTTGDANKMDAALRRIATAQGRAALGMKEQKDAFEDLGISMEQISRLSPDKIFELIAQKVSASGMASSDAGAASKILGEEMAQLNVVMQQVASEGLDGMTQAMLKNNEIMSNDTVKALDDLEQRWDTFTTKTKNKLAELVIGVLDFGEKVKQVFGWSAGPSFDVSQAEWMSQYKEPAKAVAKEAAKEKKKVEREFDPTEGVSVSAPQAADAIAKIGGIVGAQTDPQRAVAERALKIQENIEKQMKTLNDKIAKVEEHTKNLEE